MSNLSVKRFFVLLFAFIVYSFASVFSKLASQNDFLSVKYILFLVCVVAILGAYAIIWQQILKHIELTTAYMFKGTSLIFVLILSALIFNETITAWNIVGASLIIGGIVWFAKA